MYGVDQVIVYNIQDESRVMKVVVSGPESVALESGPDICTLTLLENETKEGK